MTGTKTTPGLPRLMDTEVFVQKKTQRVYCHYPKNLKPPDWLVYKYQLATATGTADMMQAVGTPLWYFLEAENKLSDNLLRKRVLSVHPPHDQTAVHVERDILAQQLKVDRDNPAIAGMQLYMREALQLPDYPRKKCAPGLAELSCFA